MRVLYANCFTNSGADLLLTDEDLVAHAFGGRARIADELIDAEEGQAWNKRLWSLAFDWFDGGADAQGRGPAHSSSAVLAADIAATEVAQTILLPAARAALSMVHAMPAGATEFATAVADAGGGVYRRVEAVQCDAAEAIAGAAGVSVSPRTSAADPRNQPLVAKYARVRDPEWLGQPRPCRSQLARAAAFGVSALARTRRGRRKRLLVLEYNPTRAFARDYKPSWCAGRALVRMGVPLDEHLACVSRGDAIAVAPQGVGRAAAQPVAPAVTDIADVGGRMKIGGVDLWPVVWPHIAAVVARYSGFVEANVARIDRVLRRMAVDSVLVPYDTPPSARLLVRVAQRAGIPTYVLNNGFMADDFQAECMTADFALAWSAAIEENYLSRRSHGETVVTGNPKAERLAAGARSRHDARGHVVVGSFTYSPVDVNCRRSDSERFLRDVLQGITASPFASRRIVVKLHPADAPDHYEAILAASPLEVEVVTAGDVAEHLRSAAVYVTTYSTSLLEAAAAGVPTCYYRINDQRLHPPFDGQTVPTASSSQELASLLTRGVAADPDGAWIERFLGPLDGLSSRRVAAAIRRTASR